MKKGCARTENKRSDKCGYFQHSRVDKGGCEQPPGRRKALRSTCIHRVTDHLNDKARAQFSPPTQQYQLLACRLETHFSRRTMRVSDQRRACVVVARGRVSYGRSMARVLKLLTPCRVELELRERVRAADPSLLKWLNFTFSRFAPKGK